MNKQTKAEWLKKELDWFEKELGWFKKELESYGDQSMLHIDWKTLDELYEQAKEMEKEQLNTARLDGLNLANKGYGK